MTHDAIEFAVDEEVRRRKRTLRIFLALLILPILVGFVALAMAPQADQPMDVRPIVRQEVQRTIEPQIATQVSAQLNEQVAPLVKEQVAKNVEPLQGQYKELSRTVATIKRPIYPNVRPDPRVADLQKQVETLSQRVASLQKQIDAMKGPR